MVLGTGSLVFRMGDLSLPSVVSVVGDPVCVSGGREEGVVTGVGVWGEDPGAGGESG